MEMFVLHKELSHNFKYFNDKNGEKMLVSGWVLVDRRQGSEAIQANILRIFFGMLHKTPRDVSRAYYMNFFGIPLSVSDLIIMTNNIRGSLKTTTSLLVDMNSVYAYAEFATSKVFPNTFDITVSYQPKKRKESCNNGIGELSALQDFYSALGVCL